MSDLAKVRAGSKLKIKAGDYNACLDAARAFRSGAWNQRAKGSQTQSDGTTILISNQTGADLDRFAVVELDGVEILPADNEQSFLARPVVTAILPTGEGKAIAILQEPVKDGELGIACVSGVCAVNLTILSAGHKFADVVAGEHDRMESAETGPARIVYQGTSTGETPELALVQIPFGGGGGGTGLVMARIIGGNAATGTGSDAPLGRLFVHSVNYTQDGALLETPPVPDWTDLDIEPDFVIGASKIPLQPTGIGFAQILRPYALGSATWSKNASWVVLSSGDPVMNVANINPDKKTITLTGNKTDIAKAATPTITVRVDGTAVTIQSIAATASGAKITLQAVADITKPIVVTWDDSAFIQGEVPVPEGSLTVTPVGDYYTIVRVLNNTGSQGYSFGAYVMLDQTAVTVADDNSVSKTCYRVIGPASQAVPHNHSSLGPTGQGRVVFTA